MQVLPAILAQNRGAFTDVGAQASAFLDILFTPAGFALAFASLAVLAVLLLSRGGTVVVAGFTIFLLSMMRTDSKWTDNTLVQPLETLRTFSRPAALALLAILALRSLGFPRGDRRRMLLLPAALFFAFQLYYMAMIGVFIDPIRALFGVGCFVAVLAAFTYGLPSLMQDEFDARAFLRIFAIAGLLFIGANLYQIVGGYQNAVSQGRLVGISGNPQQFSMTCCIYVCVGCFFFSIGAAGSWAKWIAGIALGVLGLFILWSGSRTGAICAVVILLGFFRAKVGRLALLGIVGGGAFLVAVSIFGESLDIVERFVRGSDTRSEVWLSAIADFVDSPIFGQIPIAQDDSINFVESTYLRTLSLMGAIGGTLIFAVMYTWIASAVRVWRMGREVPQFAPYADFVVASTAYFVVVNVSEGLMLGLLTLFIPFIYGVFASAAFVLESGERERELLEEERLEEERLDDEEMLAGGDFSGNHGAEHAAIGAERGSSDRVGTTG